MYVVEEEQPEQTVPSEPISLVDMRIVDQLGAPVDSITSGQQVIIQSGMCNNVQSDQTFAYIMQIKDSDNITAMLMWINCVCNRLLTKKYLFFM